MEPHPQHRASCHGRLYSRTVFLPASFFASNISNMKYPLKHSSLRTDLFSLAFSPQQTPPRFLQATRYTWWQIQECLYRFLSFYMFWKHAWWVLKQGKGESKALKRSKTGLHVLVLKLQWSFPESQRLIWDFCSSELKLSAKGLPQGRR